jgi:cobalamin biosynthesis protein CobD/CbiB
VGIAHYFNRKERLASGAEQDILNVARDTVRAGVDVDYGRVGARLSGRYVHGRTDNNFNAPGFPIIEYEGFTVVDATATYRLESLSENLTDGFMSPLFWYVLAGIPGLVLFKVVSTMDSMVGYKTPRYLRFGWCGARLDDVMNVVPARLTWLVIVAVAAVLPAYSGRKAWAVGLQQHVLLPGPNSGWSEAATAGALQRRIVGPIWLQGAQVTDLWIGDSRDPELSTSTDVNRAMALVLITGIVFAAMAVLVAGARITRVG